MSKKFWMGDPWFYYRKPRPFPMSVDGIRFWPARWQGWLLAGISLGLVFSFRWVNAHFGASGVEVVVLLLGGLSVAAFLNAEEAPPLRHRRGDLRDS
ncbi:MAG TPA: hypothetical protein VJ476_08770 [Rhizomicrobium sp.]|nr:hypothetical protein [Rhizomicrobium sp.]